ncbi:MAG TPA: tRNA (adenosine(37)-N6)-threonylcarbamoyltransferase complex ATPase subunit type 1 TsaE [Fluviicola sp.]|nr:tRNA (adenosine(37)-N6)-threonylcarbamoyltransferase complex ATPase subunit type 1 TsaE [Fluviicola sp.]
MEWVAHSLDDLPFVAKSFLESLGHNKVVVFDGQMGAGKTTFITAVLKAMGVTDPDGSPTYSIVNSYHSDYYGPVYHYDVYRLNSVEEALGIGMEETIYTDAWCFIEWGEKVREILPDDTVWVTIEANEAGERIIRLKS